ncbi:MAG TPA: pyrroline-5-carboxylate reductase [Candidatus Baltobacteraceae bacterium]|nr:pyrroline-5-carboxylate reductase [Candidatus Baltobacteraceae bacterium]
MNSIGIIGLGTLGTALASGLHRVQPELEIFATTRARALPGFVTPSETNSQLAGQTRNIVLCVKPQQARAILQEIAPALSAEHYVISTCAAVSLDVLQAALPKVRVARAMPNIACEFNEGITGVAFGAGWPPDARESVLKLFALLGEALEIEEHHFDAVTAISGCGPAYVCVITEALSDAGVKAGLPREVARMMAVQTLLGSTLLLRNVNEHPAAIRDRVTTPGGCTIDALTQLEEGRFRATLIKAVTTAAAKSAALSR